MLVVTSDTNMAASIAEVTSLEPMNSKPDAESKTDKLEAIFMNLVQNVSRTAYIAKCH